MSRIWVTSDWHLADGSWKKRPEIYGDALQSLFLLAAKVGKGDVILAAGDLFDQKTPSSETVNAAYQVISTMVERAGAKIIFIQGQHEKAKTPWLNLMPNTLHADVETHGILANVNGVKVRVYGIDWCLPSQLQEKLDNAGRAREAVEQQQGEGYDILMLHQTCNAVRAGTGDERADTLTFLDRRYGLCELRDGMLPQGFDAVIVGDTHYHTEFQLQDKGGAFYTCLSPGSFCQLAIDEINTGKCFKIEFDVTPHSLDTTIASEELYVRPYRCVKLMNPVAWDNEIREWLKEPEVSHFEKPLVRFDVYDSDADRWTQLQLACQGKCFPFLSVEKKDAEGKPADVTAEVQSLEELVTVAIQEAEATPKAKEMLIDLLAGASADEVLNAYYTKMVKK